MHVLTIAASVVSGSVAAGYFATMGFGNGPMTAADRVILAALLLGLFSALGSMFLAIPEPRRVIIQPPPERRRFDRRVIDLGNPAGIERRSGRDRRVTELALRAILAPRPALYDYESRP